jgi:hypothetical protein
MSGFTTNGLSVAVGALTGNEQAAFDTQLTQGLVPESEAISVSQLRGYYRPSVALVSASIVTTNALLGDLFTLTLATNATLAVPTGLQSGQGWKLEVTQDAVGARTLTLPTGYKASGTVTLTTTAGAIDLLSFTYDGTSILTTAALKFA